MAPGKKELAIREEVNVYMLMGVEGLSKTSATWLSKRDGLKKLLHFLAKETPRTVRKLYDEVHKESMKEFHGAPKKQAQKRPAAEFGDADCAKKARMDGVQKLGKILSRKPEYQDNPNESEATSELRKALEDDGEYDVVLTTTQEPSNTQVLEKPAEEEVQPHERPIFPRTHGAEEICNVAASEDHEDRFEDQSASILEEAYDAATQELENDSLFIPEKTALEIKVEDEAQLNKPPSSPQAYEITETRNLVASKHLENSPVTLFKPTSGVRDPIVATNDIKDNGEMVHSDDKTGGLEVQLNRQGISYEQGLTRGVKPVLVQVWQECCKLLPEHRDRLQFELKEVFETCAKLSFLKVQHQLVNFLQCRYKAPLPKAQAIPNTWETNDPHLIFNTLKHLDMHSVEANIHRVYGQMRLHAVINETATGRNIAKPTKLIRELVHRAADSQVPPAELDKRVKSYSKEYFGGRRWLEVSLWFGGMGVILVFLVAGIQINHISYEWTESQRRCFEYSAGHFSSIKGLVECLGPNSLRDFCENGFLGEEVITEVAKAEGPAQMEDGDEKSDTETDSDPD